MRLSAGSIALENARYCVLKRGDTLHAPIYFTSEADLADMMRTAREGCYIVLDLLADKMKYVNVVQQVSVGDWL